MVHILRLKIWALSLEVYLKRKSGHRKINLGQRKVPIPLWEAFTEARERKMLKSQGQGKRGKSFGIWDEEITHTCRELPTESGRPPLPPQKYPGTRTLMTKPGNCLGAPLGHT